MCILYIIMIIILIIILYKLSNSTESFHNTGIRHAKLNDWDGVISVDNLPPSWRGDRSCFKYPCPAVFEQDITCWKCLWRESEPQNE